MRTQRIKTAVLAGGVSKPESIALGWPEFRAMAHVSDRPIVSWVLDALRASDRVGDIAVVGPAEIAPVIGDAQHLPLGETMWDNVYTALNWAGSGDVLLCGADVPLLTPMAVDDLVSRGLELDADFVYPIILREVNEVRFPGMRRTYGTTMEGTFTGGNLMLARAGKLVQCDKVIRQALAARKKPLTLARMLSWRLVVKVLARRARIAELEQQVSRLLGIKARALVTSFAEIGADLDRAEEIALVESFMGERGGRTNR